MDVLHISHQSAPETRGGVESYVADVTKEQRRRGLDVQLLTGSHAPWDHVGIETLEHDGLPIHRLHRDDWYFDLHSKAWHPGVSALVAEFVERHRPRVVHLHHWIRLSSDLVEVIGARGIPVVVTLHDFYTSCPRAFRMRPGAGACDRELSVASCSDCVPRYGHEPRAELALGIELFAEQYRAELALADRVLVGVGSTAELIARGLGVDRERFEVLPLGYRRRFAGIAALPGPQPGEPLRFAFWGGVARHKGIDVLVEAARLLLAQEPRPRFELHVLGGFATAALQAELRGAAEGLPVVFHGPFTIAELLAVKPHVGVFPSTCLETFGIVLDECFELALPAIVADHGALTVRAGGGALRARPGDAVDLAAQMARLCREPATWQQLRAALPPLPPPVDVHCDALAEIYAAAAVRRAGPPPAVELVPLQRRIALLLQQRESALGHVGRGGPA